MNRKVIFITIISFISYIILQVVFLRNVSLFDFAFCYIYISFILMLPIDFGRINILFLAFILGFVVDIFYDTIGIHTAACVLTAYIRGFTLLWLSRSPTGYEPGSSPTSREMGLSWFISYASVLIFIHHFTLFLIEASNFSLIIRSFTRAIGSTVFTLIVMVCFQYFFYRSSTRRGI